MLTSQWRCLDWEILDKCGRRQLVADSMFPEFLDKFAVTKNTVINLYVKSACDVT